MPNDRLLLWSGIFAIVMLLVAAVMNLMAEYLRNRYAQGFAHWLRLRLLRLIVARPYGDFLGEHSGVMVKKVIGDVGSFVGGVLLPLLDSMARLMIVLLLLATLLLVHPWITLIASVGLLAYYGLIFRVLAGRRQVIRDQLKLASRGAQKNAQQLLGGVKAVKIHRAEEHFIEKYSQHSAVQARFLPLPPIYATAPRHLIEPVAFGGLVAAVLFYAARGQDLSVILPNLGVMALAGYRLLPAAQLLYGQFTQIGTTLHALDEVYDEFLLAEQDRDLDAGAGFGRFPRPAPLRWSHAITFENLTFQYPKAERPVINNLSLVIPKNSSLGIVGETGCGKSTLVDLLLGLHIPTSGRILIDNTPLGPENRRAWRGGIGYVPQEIFLIDDTIAANIAFGLAKKDIDPTALRDAAAAAQILNFVEGELPKGWNTVVGERGVRLSGGQRQRIGLARALYHKPDLLVLDEATSALDVATEAEVMRAIDALEGKITMIVIAHRTRLVEHCNAILKM
jgi:ABC-type multidrug transport system fused ATPase/permease subunit